MEELHVPYNWSKKQDVVVKLRSMGRVGREKTFERKEVLTKV